MNNNSDSNSNSNSDSNSDNNNNSNNNSNMSSLINQIAPSSCGTVRARRDTPTSSSNDDDTAAKRPKQSSNVDSLPDGVLCHVMAFLKGNFLNLAGTCKSFRDAYKRQHPGDSETCGENIVSSEATAKLYVAERELSNLSRSSRYRIAELAARYGRLIVLEWAQANVIYNLAQRDAFSFSENNELCLKAAGNGHIKCFEYLSRFSEHPEYAYFQPYAVRLYLTKYSLIPKNPYLQYEHFQAAAENGQLPFLRHFHEKGVRLNAISPFRSSNLCNDAATSGHLHVLKFLHEEANFELPWNICNYTVHAGHVECLDYVRGKGAKFGASLLNCAADSGQVHCLRYVFEALNEEYNGNWQDVYNKRLLESALETSAKACKFECLDYLLGLDHRSWNSLAIHRAVDELVRLPLFQGIRLQDDHYPLDGSAEKCLLRLLGVNHVQWDRERLLRLVEIAERDGKAECASCLRAFLD